jgi:signal transduction histidine kinase
MSLNSEKPINILVVEDDPLSRMIMEGFLSESKLSISHVKSAETLGAAMDLLNENEFDAVLLDLNLPDSKELDTVTDVNRISPKTAIIVITGEYSDELVSKAVVLGAQDYLVKATFDKETLSKSIHYAIERKRVEEDIKQAYFELEKANKELKFMQSQMVQSEKMASIGALAAGVAHEINTPVGFVASNFETLRSYIKKFLQLFEWYGNLHQEVESGTREERLKLMKDITRLRAEMKIDFILDDVEELIEESTEGLQRITDIVQNLRDFSRIDQAGDFGEYDLNSGIEATLVVAKNAIKYDCNIQTDFSKVPMIFCNSGQVNQVLLNILVNAAQAIESLERDDKGTITIKTYATETDVVCEISDDGPGIPADKVSKIFDPFFTTKPVGKGTGLGLSVSYDIIVNKHKGKLIVDSTVGEGTTFKIVLPIHPKKQSESQENVKDGKENSIVCG